MRGEVGGGSAGNEVQVSFSKKKKKKKYNRVWVWVWGHRKKMTGVKVSQGEFSRRVVGVFVCWIASSQLCAIIFYVAVAMEMTYFLGYSTVFHSFF